MNKFSFFTAPIRKSLTPAGEWSLRDAYEYIVSDRAKERTETLRSIDNEADRRDYKSKNFDFVTFAGTFAYRSNAGLIEPSGLMCMDIDHLPSKEALKAVKKTLMDDPFFHTGLLPISPSGDGLKWIINVANMMGYSYTAYYKAVTNYLSSIGIKADHTSDIVRACYLPYDPECIFIEEGDDDRERETFNPAAWSQQQPELTLTETKPKTEIKKTTKIKKTEGTDAQEEAQSTAGMSFDFSGISSTPRARTSYGFYLRGELEEKVEELVSKLEELGIDIAPTYNDWVKLGFRLVDGLGKDGLPFFERLSKLHKKPQKINPKDKYRQLLDEGAQRTRIDYFIEEAEDIISAAQQDDTEEPEDEWFRLLKAYS